ncbi:MAG: beta-lactamase family protein [Betaproteobacteria bacterium]|nr:beta-lactamase family protein [Betaproteobacteria bacterium]
MTTNRVEGFCAPGFEAVKAVFEANFSERGEVGASLAIAVRGKPMVDLWGGIADVQSGRAWESDTLVCMMSVAKGIVALLVHRLAGLGVIHLDDPIARWWPEFAAAGKAQITLRQVLAHVAGLPYADDLPRGSLYDWVRVTTALAAQKPAFVPGEVRCYHSATMGFIAGEVLRRATGSSINELLQAELCGPLGIDFRIGLTVAEQTRCATMIPSPGNILDIARSRPDSLFGRMWYPIADDEDFNSRAWRSSLIPSANGHGTARGVARLYSVVASELAFGDPGPVEPVALRAGIAEQWAGREHSTGMFWRQGLGFFLNWPPNRPMGPNPATFGHSGAGGAQGFGDPDSGLGFCYAPNRMHSGIDIGPRATPLIEATFACLTRLKSGE